MVHNTVVCMFKNCYWTWEIKHNQTRSRIFCIAHSLVTADWRHRGSGNKVVFSGLWSTCRSAWLSQATNVFPWGTVKTFFLHVIIGHPWFHSYGNFGFLVIFLSPCNSHMQRDVQCPCKVMGLVLGNFHISMFYLAMFWYEPENCLLQFATYTC